MWEKAYNLYKHHPMLELHLIQTWNKRRAQISRINLQRELIRTLKKLRNQICWWETQWPLLVLSRILMTSKLNSKEVSVKETPNLCTTLDLHYTWMRLVTYLQKRKQPHIFLPKEDKVRHVKNESGISNLKILKLK